MTVTADITQQLAHLRAAEPAGMAMWDGELRHHHQCPAWCERDPHLHDVYCRTSDGRAVVDHEGPEWQFFMATGQTHAESGEVLAVEVISWRMDHDEPLTVEQLRQTAADALAAAEWLEEQR